MKQQEKKLCPRQLRIDCMNLAAEARIQEAKARKLAEKIRKAIS